jgi:hypothetical protein
MRTIWNLKSAINPSDGLRQSIRGPENAVCSHSEVFNSTSAAKADCYALVNLSDFQALECIFK